MHKELTCQLVFAFRFSRPKLSKRDFNRVRRSLPRTDCRRLTPTFPLFNCTGVLPNSGH